MPSKRGSRGGRRVRRGQQAAEIRQAPEAHDNYLAVQAALTDAARQRILDWWERTNPARAGAHVADILDMLCDSDSYLNLTEPFWELRGEQLAGELDVAYGVISPAAVAAVILLGLTNVGASGGHFHYRENPAAVELLSELPPSDYVNLTERLARAAAAGEQRTVDAPDIRELAGWLDQDGRLIIRHPREEELALLATGECDSCVHPQADHDPDTGACLRVNPHMGPCPCRHTPPALAAAQQELFERHRTGAR